MQEPLFTWETLATMGGASLLTFFIVQYTKSLIDRVVKNLPTDIYAVVVAWIILTVAQLALNQPADDWRLYVLSLANAFLVAATAGQMQQKSICPPRYKNGDKNGRDKLIS